MGRDEWAILSEAIRCATRGVRPPRRPRYPDALILKMYLWCLAHERPLSWACRRSSYGGVFRPRALPSVSQFCRRVGEGRTQALLQRLHRRLAGRCDGLLRVDGKPLPVGNASKDRDAKTGYAAGGFSKGYKLHAFVSDARKLPLWSVLPLGTHEMKAAVAMLECAPAPLSPTSLVLADQNYDAAEMHKAVEVAGGRLLVPPRGFAEHAVTLRQMGAARRESLRVWRETPSMARMVHRRRIEVEGVFANLCATGGGLTHLPPWVRGLARVRRYVGGKIILYHARLEARRRAAA